MPNDRQENSPANLPQPATDGSHILRQLRRMEPEAMQARLRSDLAAVGYFIQDVVLHALTESIYACRPLLLEGPPGAGKTHLAEKLAEAYHLPKAKLSCADGIHREQALYAWDRAAQQAYLAQERERGRKLEEIRPETHTLDFLNAGPILRAFMWGATGKPGILVIDEIDKLSPSGSDMLLEPLSEWTISIEYLPEGQVRIPDPEDRPLVILTSNDIRHGVSAPLRNRALYAYITPPTLEERVRILHFSGSSLPLPVFIQAVDILERIQLQLRLIEPPGLRKGTAFIQSLTRQRVTAITRQVLVRHLCYLTSNESDYKRLNNFIPSLLEQSQTPAPELVRIAETHHAAVHNLAAVTASPAHQALSACAEIIEHIDELLDDIQESSLPM